MFKRGEVKYGLTFFALTGEKTYNIKKNLRKVANLGYSHIEFFIPAKVWMMCLPPERKLPPGYDKELISWWKTYPTKEDYFKHLKKILKWLKKYKLIPVIDFGGYWRVVHKYIWCKEIPAIFKEYLHEIREIFLDDKFIIKLINEPYVGKPPQDFVLRYKNIYSDNHVEKWANTRNVYVDVLYKKQIEKGGMPQLMARWGHFHRWISNFLEDEGFPIENILCDVNDNLKYPKVQSVWDMISGCMGKANPDRLHKIFFSNHNFMFPADLQGRVRKARRIRKYFLSNDGGSRVGLKRHGYASGYPKRNKHRSTDAKELEETLRWLFNFVKKGFPDGYKITVWHSDLLREIFQYTDDSEIYWDLDKIDYDRLAVAPKVYKEVFGEYPEHFGKIPKELEPEPPEPELKPKPKKEDNMFKKIWVKIKELWKKSDWKWKLIIIETLIILILIAC